MKTIALGSLFLLLTVFTSCNEEKKDQSDTTAQVMKPSPQPPIAHEKKREKEEIKVDPKPQSKPQPKPYVLTDADKKIMRHGENYFGYCMFCHGKDGIGTEMGDGTTMAPPLKGSKRVLGNKEITIRIVLHGLTGPVDGKKYKVKMDTPPKLMEDSDTLAAIISYVRNSWGNAAGMVTKEDVDRIRKEESGRKKPWTHKELYEKFPE